MQDRASRYRELAEAERKVARGNRMAANDARGGFLYLDSERIPNEDTDGDGVPENIEVAEELEENAVRREAIADQYERYAAGECNRFALGTLQGIEPFEGIEAQPLPPVRIIFAERDEAGNPVRNENGEPIFGPRRCEIDEDCIEIRGDERIQRGECSFPQRPELPQRWCVQPRQEEPLNRRLTS